MTRSRLRARYWRIVFFFARVTLSFIFREIVAPKIGLGRWVERTRAEWSRQIAVRFRALAIRMGGLMIKVGQFFSARLDVLPPEITDELAGLQDEVPPEPFDAIRVLAEAELGSPLAEHYASFDPNPLAAASLGQAHRACLMDADAEAAGFVEVVVKVQRPYIEQIVEVDLSALRRVGGWLSRYKPVARRADVPALVEEFAVTTRHEVDYLAEADNAERFAQNFRGRAQVSIPRVVRELTTRRVLTLEDVSAIPLGDYEAITEAGIDRVEVANVLFDTYLKQIFEDGFFHADPHPGNLFVTPLETIRPDGRRDWRLTFIDFGMVGTVPEYLREGLREVVVGVATQDGPRVVRAFKRLNVLLPSADLRLIELASMQAFDRFGGMSMSDLRDVDQAEIMSFAMQFRELIFDLPFQIPENLLLLGRSIGILSGMCSGLDPQFNLWTSIAPYASQLVSDEDTSRVQTVFAEIVKFAQTAIALPGRADRVLTVMERGELSVQTPRLEMRVRRVERAVSRVGVTLVFAAVLLAGAVVYTADAVFGRWLMAASLLPLAYLMFSRRGRHPGER